MKAETRYALRCALYGVSGIVTSLLSSLPLDWGDLPLACLLGASAALTYAGIGAAVPQIEPHIGNKLSSKRKERDGHQ